MSPETVNQIRAANLELARFLAQIPRLLPGEQIPALGRIQGQLLALDSMTSSLARSLGPSDPRAGLDDEARTQVDLYAANLEQLRDFVTRLQAYAETRRGALRRQAHNLVESMRWCETAKITLAE